MERKLKVGDKVRRRDGSVVPVLKVEESTRPELYGTLVLVDLGGTSHWHTLNELEVVRQGLG